MKIQFETLGFIRNNVYLVEEDKKTFLGIIIHNVNNELHLDSKEDFDKANLDITKEELLDKYLETFKREFVRSKPLNTTIK